MEFDFNEWSNKAKLTQTTVEILKAEDLTTAEVLETLSEADILSLKLTLGQRNLLKKEVEKLKRRNAKASSDNTDSGEAMDLGDESEQSSTPDLPSSAHGKNETSKRQKRSSTEKSVLILNDEWGTSKGGISTVHRQVAQQAQDAGFDVHVTTLEEPSGEDLSDAEAKGIKIIKAKKKGSKKPDLSCITITHKTYFPGLEEENFKVIIGHIPITSEGADDIKKDRLKGCRVFQFAHTIPEDTDVFKDGSNPMITQEKEDKIIELAKRADVVFSVGPRIYNHYDGKFRRLSNVVHRQYIPYPDKGFFDLQIKLPNQTTRCESLLSVASMELHILKDMISLLRP
ncbi:uncharacterized protein [Ptychodera flava]|uniref:uncharacterized protein n=1 Tax=Ptychodera flava TaxID=63121 RepID=UPI00396A937B